MTINIKGYNVLIDDILAPMILARKWQISDRKRGIYFSTSTRLPSGKRRNIKLHRFILEAPPDMLVDHKDGNHLDCRRQNLRVCNTAQNTQNTPILKRNKTGYRGVSYHGKTGKYRAVISCNGKYIHLGYFDTPEAASEIYNAEAKKLFGEFYRDTRGEN